MFSIVNQILFYLADLGPDSNRSALANIRIADVLLEVELRYASFTLTINKHSVTCRMSIIWMGNYIFLYGYKNIKYILKYIHLLWISITYLQFHKSFKHTGKISLTTQFHGSRSSNSHTKTAIETYSRAFQLKIFLKILSTKIMLCIWGIEQDSKCRFCHGEEEDIMLLYWYSQTVRSVWLQVQRPHSITPSDYILTLGLSSLATSTFIVLQLTQYFR